MSVKVIVSSEELKKTMELLALISAPAGKKKDEDAKQLFNTMRITAVCPHRDKNYMLIFGKAGNGEQLTYRMEGKSTVSSVLQFHQQISSAEYRRRLHHAGPCLLP